MIWRRACVKLWGSECVPASYGGSWRHMFITRPHPHFHGNPDIFTMKDFTITLQEFTSVNVPMYDEEKLLLIVIIVHFIPWFIIGIFASTLMVKHTLIIKHSLILSTLGRVLYFTSPDDPALCVNKMKGHGNYQSLLGGHFTVSEVDGERKVAIFAAMSTRSGVGLKPLHFKQVHISPSVSPTYYATKNTLPAVLGPRQILQVSDVFVVFNINYLWSNYPNMAQNTISSF